MMLGLSKENLSDESIVKKIMMMKVKMNQMMNLKVVMNLIVNQKVTMNKINFTI